MGRYISPDNFQFVDENGIPYGVKHVANKPRVSSMPYLEPSERSYQKEIEELRAVVMMNLPTVEPKYVLSDAKQYFYAGF